MKTLFSTVLGLGLLASAAAIAAPAPAAHGDGHRTHPASTPAPQQRAQSGKAQPAQPAQQPARPAQHSQAQPARQHAQPAGHATSQTYRKGGHLPAGQRGVRMSDWRAKGLHSPGRGQEWRQLDGRYLLIATANGLIVDILSARR